MPTMRIPYGVLDGRYINSAGDNMMGQLTLSGDPTSDLHATTKQYVDNADLGSLKKDGSVPLTADWDAGNFKIRAQTLEADMLTSEYSGIGTLSPDRKLEVLDTAGPQLRLAHTDGTLYTDFQTDSSGDLNIIPSGGDVKLPNCLLTINGPYRSDRGHLCIHGTTNYHAYQTIYYNNSFMAWYGLLSNNLGFCMYNSGSGGNMIFYSKPAQGESARFDANGNFGIGTTGPDRKLDVRDSSAPQLRLTHTDGSVYSDFQTTSDGNLSINTSGGNIYIGSTSVNNSGTFVVDRYISSGVGNFRGIRDETTFSRSGTVAYACFDAEASLNGSYDYDHIVGFQSRPAHNSTGTLSMLAGFSSVTRNNGGTVASAWGLRVYDVAGTGAVTNNYGVYVNSLTRGTNNYAIYTEGNTKSYFGGNVGIGVNAPGRKLDVLDSSNPQLRLTHTSESVYTDFQTTSSGYLYLNPSGGRIGIGTSSPAIRLEVTDTSDPTNGEVARFSSTATILSIGRSGGSPSIWFGGNSNMRFRALGGKDLEFCVQSQVDSDVIFRARRYNIFRYYDGSNTYDRATFDLVNGKLGIDTTAPARKLEIVDASNPQLRLTHTDGSVYTDFQATSDGGLKISPSGNKLGFFGVAPAERPVYTLSNVTTDRNYNADATTLNEIADILGTLINDLKAYGLLQ